VCVYYTPVFLGYQHHPLKIPAGYFFMGTHTHTHIYSLACWAGWWKKKIKESGSEVGGFFYFEVFKKLESLIFQKIKELHKIGVYTHVGWFFFLRESLVMVLILWKELKVFWVWVWANTKYKRNELNVRPISMQLQDISQPKKKKLKVF
jgi:hypothetical protein